MDKLGNIALDQTEIKIFNFNCFRNVIYMRSKLRIPSFFSILLSRKKNMKMGILLESSHLPYQQRKSAIMTKIRYYNHAILFQIRTEWQTTEPKIVSHLKQASIFLSKDQEPISKKNWYKGMWQKCKLKIT